MPDLPRNPPPDHATGRLLVAGERPERARAVVLACHGRGAGPEDIIGVAGALVAWSGGLIGPPGTPRDYAGSLSGTPVFLGCSDVDPHIPAGRVRESAEVLRRLGAEVDMRFYPGLGHTVNGEELEITRQMVGAVANGTAGRRSP